MKKTFILLMSFLLLSLSCEDKSKQLNSSNAKTTPNETKALDELDKEAIAQFQTFFEQYFSKCGDSYFVEIGASPEKRIVRLKDVSFNILTEQNISEADKLEKIDWSGEVIPRVKVSKSYLFDKKSCTKWEDGGRLAFSQWGGYVTVSKEKGVWEVGNDILGEYYNRFNKVECSTLPPCLNE